MSSQASPPPPGDLFAQHADLNLESQLPAVIGRTILTLFSLGASDIITAANEAAYMELLGMVGRSTADLTMATARDLSGQIQGWVTALRVEGAAPEDLLKALIAMERKQAAGTLAMGPATVGGKDVTEVDFGGDEPTQYLYGRGDIVFAVYGFDQDTAARFLEALP